LGSHAASQATRVGSLAAGAKNWESKTLAFDNVNVHSIVARALGIDLRAAALADGSPPPAVDGKLSDGLADLLFDLGAGGARAAASSSGGRDSGGGSGGDGGDRGDGDAEDYEDKSPESSGYALWSSLLMMGLLGVAAGARVVFSRFSHALPAAPKILPPAPWTPWLGPPSAPRTTSPNPWMLDPTPLTLNNPTPYALNP